MKNEIQEPVLIEDDPLQGQKFEHPAYGQISASRITGTAALYGSDFEHRAFIELRISRSQLMRSTARDWNFASGEIVSIYLSEAQWATFVSSLNVGEGVPCTLHHVTGERQPDLPLRAERDVVASEVVKHAREMGEQVTKTIEAIEGELGESVSKKRRVEILTHLKSLQQNLNNNVGFYVNSFDQHMEDTVEKAKIEVGAYVQATIQRAGLESLGVEPISLLVDNELGEDIS